MRVAAGLFGVLIAASGCERAFMIEVLPGGTEMTSVELYLGVAPCEPSECDVAIPGIPTPPGLVSYIHDAPQAFRAEGSGPLYLELQASALGDYIPIAIAVGFDANGKIVGSARLPDLHVDESMIYRVELSPLDKVGQRLWFARQPAAPKAACVVREAGADKLEMIVPAGDFDCDGIDVAIDTCPQIYDPSQRDFDGDTRPDACDPCPHLHAVSTERDPDRDADSDGVGDGCDPYPGTPGDRRVLWSGFQDSADLSAWTIETGTWSVDATGGLMQTDPTQDASLTSGTTLDNAFIQTRFQVVTIGTTDAEIGVCAGLQPMLGQHLCCDVLASPQSQTLIETWWNDSTGLRGVRQEAWPGLLSGAVIELDFQLTAQSAKCVGRGLAGGGAFTANAIMPVSGDISGAVGVYMESSTARYDYVFVVESP